MYFNQRITPGMKVCNVSADDVVPQLMRDVRGVKALTDLQQISGSRIILHGTPQRVSSHGQSVIAGAGRGDCLETIRWATLLARAGATVGIDVHHDLRRLLAKVDGVSEIVTDWAAFQPHYHVHLIAVQVFGLAIQEGRAFAELSRISKKTFREMIGRSPQCHIKPGRRFDLPDNRKIRIGLCWAGNPEHSIDPIRSAPLKSLAPLGQVPGTEWYSLQYGAGREQLSCAPFEIIDRMDDVKDFDDCAALVDALDMVVTVDTSTSALAGGMGKRMFILFPDKCAKQNRHVEGDRVACWPNARLVFPLGGPIDFWDNLDRRRRIWYSVAGCAANKIREAVTGL